MKILVCGSRSWTHSAPIAQRLADLPTTAEIIHGGAQGADHLADRWARAFGNPVTVFEADWETHGKRAGIIRNLAMLDQDPDLVIAFWDGQSKGTAHTITEARKRSIPVEVVQR